MTIHLSLGRTFAVEVTDDEDPHEDPITGDLEANLILDWDEAEDLTAALVAFILEHRPPPAGDREPVPNPQLVPVRPLQAEAEVPVAPPESVMGFNRYKSTYVAVGPV